MLRPYRDPNAIWSQLFTSWSAGTEATMQFNSESERTHTICGSGWFKGKQMNKEGIGFTEIK